MMTASLDSSNTHQQNRQFSQYCNKDTCWNDINIQITQWHFLLYQTVFALFSGDCVFNFTPCLLHPWERIPVPNNKRQNGAQNWSGAFDEKKSPFVLHSNTRSSRP